MRVFVSATILVAAFLLIYLPDVGHGFIKDDFAWIGRSQVTGAADVLTLFTTNIGFYRPLVSASFAADQAVWGLDARGYGLTNLGLLAIGAGLLFALARSFGLASAAALLSAAVWVFNFHAVNMALLWLSGRTALLASVFALATVLAVLRGFRVTAGSLCLATLLCREEAVVLPVLLAAFLFADPSPAAPARRLRAAVAGTGPLWAALVVYAVLRSQSGAFTPLDAPPFYQFSWSPALLARNIVEYADRAMTVAAAVALILCASTGHWRPRFTDYERRVLVFAAIWVPAMYALTVLLPVRSSLYALMPSLGVALAVGAIGSWAARTAPVRFRHAVTGLVLLTLLLVPIYRSRNARWVAIADLSSMVIQAVTTATVWQEGGGHIALVDAPAERVNLDAAFGSLLPEAVALTVGPGWTAEVVAPGTVVPVHTTLAFRYEHGRLAAVAGRRW